tara:strand:- start:1 stop:363 length:363 start_codon:yes stop_codon:yes gene_type:complete
MKEFKGTKGEWRIQEQFDSPNLIVDEENDTEWHALSSYVFGNDKIIGETRYGTSVNGGYPSVNILSEMRANAKLIAAAPELLKALKSCVMSMQAHPDCEENSEFEGFVNNGWEAINKALN